MEKHFPGLYSTTGAAISKDKARELYAAGNSDSPNYHVRRAIVSLLNYFEFICLSRFVLSQRSHAQQCAQRD